MFAAKFQPTRFSLQSLSLSNTGLTNVDMETISSAVQSGKLPQLQYLGVSENILTSSIRDLVGGPNHPGFVSLENLELCSSRLSTADVKCLVAAIRGGKFPRLQVFPFLPECWTDLLSDKFSVANHPAFPFWEKLTVQNRELTEGDEKYLHSGI